MFLISCVKHYDLDILGLAETHLTGDNVISVEGYQWFGLNRKHIHVRAKSGSGGVGILIRNSICNEFDITIADNDTEGILWIKLENKTNANNVLYVCVVYLPPENSTRAVNVHEFFDNLMTKVYTVPQGNPFYICGDWNSRCSDFVDSITGIDNLPDRHVVDFQCNSYGKVFCEFLTDISCCILNGRNTLLNDYTYVSTRGLSVVDYCVVPYEMLDIFNKFKVTRTSLIIEQIYVLMVFVNKRKLFDKAVQKAKRQYWYSMQEELSNSCGNPKEFWRKIGKIGVGSERQNYIPMEVKLDNGQISSDKDEVLNKWKCDFSNMFNRNDDSDVNICENDVDVLYDDMLDCEISVEEVFNVLKCSKNGKSPGYDEIPVELYKNQTMLNALTRVFQYLFLTLVKFQQCGQKGL
ncbi:Hypothetical predicted protein [Mytilus galloprovincialis]|uniref:Endonuclease/exonuclease/phosphatase domain-containing protein n=1 Tax=Mytilus galloprovincialis TaxID=29158 RepID=A0A8B6ECD7_MYTGA|nr:Hypothetical predicted protein [Mytilus galloprovincialis]